MARDCITMQLMRRSTMIRKVTYCHSLKPPEADGMNASTKFAYYLPI